MGVLDDIDLQVKRKTVEKTRLKARLMRVDADMQDLLARKYEAEFDLDG